RGELRRVAQPLAADLDTQRLVPVVVELAGPRIGSRARRDGRSGAVVVACEHDPQHAGDDDDRQRTVEPGAAPSAAGSAVTGPQLGAGVLVPGPRHDGSEVSP